MDVISIILLSIFILAVTCIALEHKLQVDKSWVALLAGCSMWVLMAYGQNAEDLHEALSEGSAEIFGLIVFLMGAMTIVEMIAHFRFFTWIESKLLELNISNRQLFWILGGLTFLGSTLLDNLTSTLIMIQIGRHLYIKKDNFNIFVVNTIIAANAGGALSPVGDVTTIMMWLEGKFTAWQIVAFGFLPSLVAWVIPQAILTRQIEFEDRTGREAIEVGGLKWTIIILGFVTFGFAVLVNLLNLPPFIGILLGLAVAAIVIDVRLKKGKLSKHAGRIVNLIKTIDMATITFFIGILLAVNALDYHGILGQIAIILFGNNPSANPDAIILAHTTLGLVSSFLDNVPLTAAVIDMFAIDIHFKYWILLAITAGTGGSILIIGSAAGVAAMGQVKDLSFTTYFKKGTLPALLGYGGAIITWWLLMG